VPKFWFSRARGRAVIAALALAAVAFIPAVGAGTATGSRLPRATAGAAVDTATPIKHLVVIFDENISFDHYFGTYPNALNPPGEPAFHAAPGTPSVNGLGGALLTRNPNLSNPQRLDRSQALTCDQDHDYTPEQEAFDHGLMDRFVQDTGGSETVKKCTGKSSGHAPNYAVMDYYDGNTVTALWNYAQHYALNDNSFGTNFGPSTPGAIDVTAGNTYGAICGPSSAVYHGKSCAATPGSAEGDLRSAQPAGPGTVYSDADPNFDVCSKTEDGSAAADTIQMGGKNVGDLLDEAHVTWGWFEGGFASPHYVPGKPQTDDLAKVCTGTHRNIGGATVTDYIPHHEPFQYYASTANPKHLPPTSIAMIGHQDRANHQYDITDFWAAADADDLPQVSYLKAPAYEDGHAGYSDPLDEQRWLVETINRLQRLPSWRSTAVIINWDDSDGWYDHQMGPIVDQSQTPLDMLTGTGTCGSNLSRVPRNNAGAPEQARCGVGPRIPMLVISPYAKRNFVDSAFTTQSSVIRFIEYNWLAGKRLGNGAADSWSGPLDNMFDFSHANSARLILNPKTGEPVRSGA
jgi:phospholipase C